MTNTSCVPQIREVASRLRERLLGMPCAAVSGTPVNCSLCVSMIEIKLHLPHDDVDVGFPHLRDSSMCVCVRVCVCVCGGGDRFVRVCVHVLVHVPVQGLRVAICEVRDANVVLHVEHGCSDGTPFSTHVGSSQT